MTPRQRIKARQRLIDQLRDERERQGLSRAALERRGGPSVECVKGMERANRYGCTLLTAITYADALGWGVCLTKKAPQGVRRSDFTGSPMEGPEA